MAQISLTYPHLLEGMHSTIARLKNLFAGYLSTTSPHHLKLQTFRISPQDTSTKHSTSTCTGTMMDMMRCETWIRPDSSSLHKRGTACTRSALRRAKQVTSQIEPIASLVPLLQPRSSVWSTISPVLLVHLTLLQYPLCPPNSESMTAYSCPFSTSKQTHQHEIHVHCVVIY